MSEIRTTTSVELIQELNREPYVCLADVVMGGLGLAVRASTAAADLAHSGIRSLIQNAQVAHSHSLTLSSMTALVGSAKTAQEALLAVAGGGEVKIPKAKATALAVRLKGIVERNDIAELQREVRGAITAGQNRIHAAMIPMVVKACAAVGFKPEQIDASTGLIVVRGDNNERATIDVAKGKEGEVKLHFDTDGFEKDQCTTKFVEPVIRSLQSQGAKFGTKDQLPKRGNVYDRRRVGAKALSRTRR